MEGEKGSNAVKDVSPHDFIKMELHKELDPIDLDNMKLVTIPEELIFDNILPRLPVKSLLGFKTVCKHWCCTISNPHFKKSHLAFSLSRHQFLTHEIPDTSEVGVRVVGCSNGLIALNYSRPPRAPTVAAADSHKNKYDMQLLVLNPATRHRIYIDAPYVLKSASCYYWFGWFGHVSSIDDYKIVAWDFDKFQFWTFSFKTRKWSKRSGDGVSYGRRYGPMAQVDDSLYWSFDVSGPVGNSSGNVGTYITKLNLVSEEVEFKPKMNNFIIGRGYIKLFNLKGCLALHTKSGDVWLLRQKDDWHSWEKVYSKVLKDVKLLYIYTTSKLVIRHLDQVKLVDDLSELASAEKDDGGTTNNIKWNGVGIITRV